MGFICIYKSAIFVFLLGRAKNYFLRSILHLTVTMMIMIMKGLEGRKEKSVMIVEYLWRWYVCLLYACLLYVYMFVYFTQVCSLDVCYQPINFV